MPSPLKAQPIGPQGIVTNAIAPGSIMTELTKQLFYGNDGKFFSKTEAFMQHIPLGRPGTTDEIAEAVEMNEDVTRRVLSKADSLAKAVRSARVGQTTV